MDYSNSAINLVNPATVGLLLEQYRRQQEMLAELRAKADACIPQEVKDSIAKVESEMNQTREVAEETIAEDGSYQDLDKKLWGIQQRRVSLSYNALEFESHYPQFAPAVIVKAVDEAKVKGLLKGGLLDMKTLLSEEVAKEKESYRFIIEAAPVKEVK